jgi:hypothetical protein
MEIEFYREKKKPCCLFYIIENFLLPTSNVLLRENLVILKTF